MAYNLRDVVSKAEGLDWQRTSLRVSGSLNSAFVQRLNAGERNCQLGLIGGFLGLARRRNEVMLGREAYCGD